MIKDTARREVPVSITVACDDGSVRIGMGVVEKGLDGLAESKVRSGRVNFDTSPHLTQGMCFQVELGNDSKVICTPPQRKIQVRIGLVSDVRNTSIGHDKLL